MIRRIRWLPGGLGGDVFALITPCFDNFELWQGEALIERFDPRDELRGESNPLILSHGKKPLMLVAILESHTSFYHLSMWPIGVQEESG